ncbi:hypothetical protein Pla52n_44410 [Stieleria varia]|uniref:Uncharacterized protein n=1 Tax=Stieleria varia TaxID=2528005 RepID=A0A5C6AN23_9BACT|nr:hypothetical protein Pla52n_44410 [Stieleria varia]
MGCRFSSLLSRNTGYLVSDVSHHPLWVQCTAWVLCGEWVDCIAVGSEAFGSMISPQQIVMMEPFLLLGRTPQGCAYVIFTTIQPLLFTREFPS